MVRGATCPFAGLAADRLARVLELSRGANVEANPSGACHRSPVAEEPRQESRMIIRGSLVAVSIVALAVGVLAQAPNDAPPTDAVTRLGQQLERGEATLEYRDGVGYLPSLLEHLRINVDSQTLVFS